MIPVRFGLYVAALCTALIVGPRGPLYWDSFGYVRDAVTWHLSGLGAGRPWFSVLGALVLRASWHLGVSVSSSEMVLRTFWMAIAALAAPATHALAKSCGLSARASLFAAIAVVFSPAMAHSSRAVLSDGPAVAVSLIALVAGVRATCVEPSRFANAWGATAGVLLALAIGLREQSVYVIVSFAWLAFIAPRSRRMRSAAVILASFVVALMLTVWIAFAIEPHLLDHIGAWRRAMTRERALHHYGAYDLARYAAWLVALGPATLFASAAAWFRERDRLWSLRSAIAAVCVPALAQLALLGGYQDIAYSPRYLLPALAGALALPAALTFDRWSASPRAVPVVLVLLIAPAAICAPVLRQREAPLRAIIDSIPARLANVPRDAIIVTGQPCPAIQLQRTLQRTAAPGSVDWRAVCPGWSWPDDLESFLERERGDARMPRTIVLDVRPDAWLGAGQRTSLELTLQYAARHTDRSELILWR